MEPSRCAGFVLLLRSRQQPERETTMLTMPIALTEEQRALKAGVADICKRYPGEYWRDLDARRDYPEAFVTELTRAGYLAALIPQEYGGAGLGLFEGGLILETINANGGNAAACHAQMYIMGTLLRHGSEAQKRRYLPKIASGELRLQAFAVTEPNSGSDTTKLQTTAVRQGDRYVVNGQKMFISRVKQSDLMLLLARTTPVDQVKRKTDGLSVFLVDIRERPGLDVRPLRMMMNHSTNALFFDQMEIPADSLIGEEGRGFAYILDGMNAERVLVASDSLGDGRWFIEKAVAYSSQRVIFGKPIGTNQGVQFPIARAHTAVEAAELMRNKAAALFDAGQPCGPEANMAKYLAAEAAWEAANACIDCHGGYGYAEEYDIERKFREARLYKTAPVNQNLVLAYVGEHVLGLPRSY
jgi:alkylation response protein AidB-like acyl-CoA dehydrogenase